MSQKIKDYTCAFEDLFGIHFAIASILRTTTSWVLTKKYENDYHDFGAVWFGFNLS